MQIRKYEKNRQFQGSKNLLDKKRKKFRESEKNLQQSIANFLGTLSFLGREFCSNSMNDPKGMHWQKISWAHFMQIFAYFLAIHNFFPQCFYINFLQRICTQT